MDCETFDVSAVGNGSRLQDKHYDFWWNLPRDYMVSSEWGLPPQFEKGVVPEDLLGNQIWPQDSLLDLRARRNVQTIDLGANHQMALEVRPAHDPIKEYGFVGVVADSPTSRARFGPGGAKAANSIAKRPRSFRPSRRRRSSFHRCFRGSAPCRH